VALALLALVTVLYADPKLLWLEAFTITLGPFIVVLLMEQATAVRNNVEPLLSDFLMDYSWAPETSVTYFGLARVLESTVSNDAIQVTMDGLVYFSDTVTGIPDSAGMNQEQLMGLG
jgi:hypothetical protein